MIVISMSLGGSTDPLASVSTGFFSSKAEILGLIAFTVIVLFLIALPLKAKFIGKK